MDNFDTWTDDQWKDVIGDFEMCNFCNKLPLKQCNCKICKNRSVDQKGLSCGDHHMDHKYLVEHNRKKYIENHG